VGSQPCGLLLGHAEQPAPDSPGRGVHAALARQGVDLSPPRMWVLPDGVPACRGPTIACMGFLNDWPAPGLRLREPGPAGPVRYPFAGADRPALAGLPVVDAAGRNCRAWLRAERGAVLTGPQ
jgi:hypothetical protein